VRRLPQVLVVALMISLISAIASEGKAAEGLPPWPQPPKRISSKPDALPLGEYREALDQFKEAYRLKQDPSFLYNIAQCQPAAA